MNFKKPKLIIKERRIHFPRIPWVGIELPLNMAFRLPSLEGLALGQNPKAIVLMALMVSAAVLSGAVYFAVHGVNAAPIWPQAAVYDAAQAQQLGHDEIKVGTEPVEEPSTPTMTLQLNIGSARISELVFEDMSIGKASGLTDAINISSTAGNIICETLLLEDVEATDFTLATSTAYAMTISTTTADGLSISPTLASTPVKYAFGSTRGALSVPAVRGGTFDRILISSNATSTVGQITFRRVKAYGAGITLKDLKCGEIIIRGTSADESVYGDGTGIDSASFTVNSTVTVQSSTLIGNVERPVSVR
tara:strand:+ start:4282 stop:5199 length:918 start_codon:yes stop_codon:yes gene_type:complete